MIEAKCQTSINWLNKTATYHYDAAGRLDWIDNFNATITGYGYDTVDRLTSMIE